MPAGKYDITIEQGATFSLVLSWKDSQGNPIDLTGYTAKMDVRRSYSSSDTLLSLRTNGEGIQIQELNGKINLSASAELTEKLPPVSAVYDLELTSPGGIVTRLLEGRVVISPEITR